jgi:hypothetical protein
MAPAPISLAAAPPRLKLRDPTSTVTPFATSSLSDSLIGPGDQGDAFVRHVVLLYVGRLAALAI